MQPQQHNASPHGLYSSVRETPSSHKHGKVCHLEAERAGRIRRQVGLGQSEWGEGRRGVREVAGGHKGHEENFGFHSGKASGTLGARE